jgi:hypothetical protein
VNAGELKRLKYIEKKYNSSQSWMTRRIKIFIEPYKKGKLKIFYGFTKVGRDEDAEMVLAVIEEMSAATPRLTWLVYDEGGLTKNTWMRLKAGKFRG